MMTLPRRLLLLLLFCITIVSIFYYFRFKSNEQIKVEKNDAIFVEFLPCLKEPRILVASPGSKIKELFDSLNCRLKQVNSELMEEEVHSGDRIWLDSSGVLHKGRMDGKKLYTLGLKMPLNSASEDELSLIPGIGRELAQRIVKKRDEIGSFKSYSQLLEVKGIGGKKLRLLKEATYISED